MCADRWHAQLEESDVPVFHRSSQEHFEPTQVAIAGNCHLTRRTDVVLAAAVGPIASQLNACPHEPPIAEAEGTFGSSGGGKAGDAGDAGDGSRSDHVDSGGSGGSGGSNGGGGGGCGFSELAVLERLDVPRMWPVAEQVWGVLVK